MRETPLFKSQTVADAPRVPRVPKALIMCSVTNSHRGGGFDIWAQFCLNIPPVVLGCLENHKRRNLTIIGERDCSNAPNIWQRCKEWPTASELMFTKSRKSEEQVWVVNDAWKNALYWFSFQRSQSSDFDKWSWSAGGQKKPWCWFSYGIDLYFQKRIQNKQNDQGFGDILAPGFSFCKRPDSHWGLVEGYSKSPLIIS